MIKIKNYTIIAQQKFIVNKPVREIKRNHKYTPVHCKELENKEKQTKPKVSVRKGIIKSGN